jgi:hypothetical protein
MPANTIARLVPDQRAAGAQPVTARASTQLFPEHMLPVDRTNTPQMTRPLGSTPTAPSRGFTATTGRSPARPATYSLRCGSAAWQAPSRIHSIVAGGPALELAARYRGYLVRERGLSPATARLYAHLEPGR